jgi:hypothetical protein
MLEMDEKQNKAVSQVIANERTTIAHENKRVSIMWKIPLVCRLRVAFLHRFTVDAFVMVVNRHGQNLHETECQLLCERI